MKSLGPGKVVQAFNPRKLKQGVQGQPETKQVPNLIWDPPSAGGLHKNVGRKIRSSMPACIYLPAHLLEPTSTEDQLKKLALWD